MAWHTVSLGQCPHALGKKVLCSCPWRIHNCKSGLWADAMFLSKGDTVTNFVCPSSRFLREECWNLQPKLLISLFFLLGLSAFPSCIFEAWSSGVYTFRTVLSSWWTYLQFWNLPLHPRWLSLFWSLSCLSDINLASPASLMYMHVYLLPFLYLSSVCVTIFETGFLQKTSIYALFFGPPWSSLPFNWSA